MPNDNPQYNSTQFFLRPEAGPVPYRKLQRRTQDTLKSIVEALGAAVDSARRITADGENTGSTFAIDKNRASRLFFVSGEPGSGKSTLYVTLRAMLSKDEATHDYYRAGYDSEDSGGSNELKGLINGLSGAVRWLEPIDLEVVGDKEENLLAAVLVRLTRELAETGSGYSSDCDGAIKKLEQLAADIGMAWESNLSARAGELDPDSYSMEVMRGQEARLGVNERLRDALDKLAKNNCHGCNSSTLFVLPVDDLYLRPDASLQLLRLLRMISVPRLFFLIMGDVTTVEALFTEKALADWTRVAGAEVFQILPDRLDVALARARELRARFLRKLLPPRQRAEIQPMDWHEAMRFQPERRNGNADADALARLMVGVKLDRPWTDEVGSNESQDRSNLRNLFDFLTCRPFKRFLPFEQGDVLKEVERLRDGKGKKSWEAYTALQLLDATPREVMDLWSALQKFIDDENKRLTKASPREDGSAGRKSSQELRQEEKIPLLSLVLEFVRLNVEEQNFLNEKEQGVVVNKVLPTRRYYDPDAYIKMDFLRLEPESGGWVTVSSDKKVWVRKHLPWKLGVKCSGEEEKKARPDKLKISLGGRQVATTAECQVELPDESSERGTQQTSGEFNFLPPRPTAWIVLLHDLARLWRPGSMDKSLVEGLRQELFKTLEGEPTNKFPGWAVISDDEPLKIPEFDTVRELDCFLRVWNRGIEWQFPDIEKPKLPKETADEAELRIRLLWAFAGWTVIEEQYDNFARQDFEWFEQGLKIDQMPSSKTKSKGKAAVGNQDTLEEWKEKLKEFRKTPKIKDYLLQLSKFQDEQRYEGYDVSRPISSQTTVSFEDWIKEPPKGKSKPPASKGITPQARKSNKKKK